jgi:membrane-associated phospholipid phosphatase
MESLFPIEINFTLFLQNLGTWLTSPLKIITFLGNEEFYILIMPLIFWCVNSIAGIRTGLMLILSGGINAYLKILIHMPRPYWVDTRVKALTSETSFGLPSGHSQNAASIWGSLAVSLRRKWLTIVVLITIFLIGFSRMYLGVHFLHDVLSGWLVGGLLLWGYMLLEKRIVRWIAPKSLTSQIIYALVFSALIVVLGLISYAAVSKWQLPVEWINNAIAVGADAPDPFSLDGLVTLAGVAFGFLSGLAWWVKKFGFPTIESRLLHRVFRYLIGMVGLAAIYLGLKLILPEEPYLLAQIFRFLRYGLIGLWVTALAPLIFRKLKI